MLAKTFYNDFLKSFSDNSSIFVVLLLVSIDCLFFIQGEIFLVLGIISDFLKLKLGNLSIMRIWILFKLSVLADFL